MTLSSTTVKDQYNGDGSTTDFPTTFVFWNSSDLRVVLTDSNGDETVWTEGTEYTVTGGDGSTGTVSVETAPTDFTPQSGERLTIKSNLPDTQGTDLVVGGTLDVQAIEERLDKNVRLTQQQAEEIDRSPKLRESTTSTTPTFPEPSANDLLAWNSDGDDLENKAVADISAATFPASATDNAVPRYDGTSGTSLQNSGVIVDDSDNVSGVNDLDIGGNQSLSGYTDLSEIATPANPAADTARLYAFDDSGTTRAAFRDSSGAETLVQDVDSEYTPSWTGGVPRTIRSRFEDHVDIRDFDVDPAGNNDSTTGVQGALDQADGDYEITVLPGDFAITTSLNVTAEDTIIKGSGPATGRTNWSKQRTRLFWGGGTSDNLIHIDPSLTELVRGVGLQGIVLDGAQTTGITLVRIEENNPFFWMEDVVMRRCDRGLLMLERTTGNRFRNVHAFDFERWAWDLRGNNHRTSFYDCKADNVDVTSSNSVVRIGASLDFTANLNFYGCEFQAKGVDYMVEALEVYGLGWFGGYMETAAAGVTGLFRLGASSTSQEVRGFICKGGFFQCGSSETDYVFDADGHLVGADISGNYFGGTAGVALINNNGAESCRLGPNRLGGNTVFGGTNLAQGFDHSTPVQITLADDAAIALTPPAQFSGGAAVGKIEVWTRRQPAHGGALFYDASGGAANTQLLFGTSSFTAATGTLGGTDGADGDLTVSAHTDGMVYIENRLGQSNDIVYSFCEPWGSE